MENRELLFSVTLEDCEIQTFRSGGKGGQHQNKTESGVRIIHRPSGAVGESREQRHQHANKKSAFVKMANSDKFNKWIKLEVARKSGQPSIESQVRKEMLPFNIRIDSKDEKNRWIENKELLPSEQEIESLF